MILCADTSEAPIQVLWVDGCGFIQRAYMDTAMNAASRGLPCGITLAAAMVPIPLTAILSFPGSLTGATCRKCSTSTRLDNGTTRHQRSYEAGSQGPSFLYGNRSATSSGGFPASCNSATSACSFRAISASSRHGFRRLSIFQLTILSIGLCLPIMSAAFRMKTSLAAILVRSKMPAALASAGQTNCFVPVPAQQGSLCCCSVRPRALSPASALPSRLPHPAWAATGPDRSQSADRSWQRLHGVSCPQPSLRCNAPLEPLAAGLHDRAGGIGAVAPCLRLRLAEDALIG